MEKPEPMTKDALSRACIRLGTALPKDASKARTQLATLQRQAELVHPDDSTTMATIEQELAKLMPKD